MLLEKESLERRIDKAVTPHPHGTEEHSNKNKKEDLGLSQAWSREIANARKVESEERTGDVEKHILTLREEVKNARDEICRRKADLERRGRDFECIRASLPGRRTSLTNKLTDSMRKGSQSWLGIHSKTTDTRAFLCREAALLYRLRQKKKARAGEHYSIGGLPLVDLKEINSTLMASNHIWGIY